MGNDLSWEKPFGGAHVHFILLKIHNWFKFRMKNGSEVSVFPTALATDICQGFDIRIPFSINDT